MQLRLITRELPLWGAIIALSFQLVERLAAVVAISPYINWVASQWGEWVQLLTNRFLDWLGQFGLSATTAYSRILPIELQLAIVVALAFVYFGMTPYWVRARRSLSLSSVLWRYGVHLAANVLLIAILLSSFHSAMSSIAIPVPATSLDWILLSTLIGSLGVLVLWHPGMAIRVLIVLLGIWLTKWIALLSRPLLKLLQQIPNAT